MKGLPATSISILLWRVIAAVGARPGPPFVERDVAIIDTLLVFPFLTEPFLACESCVPIRWRDCAHGLTGIGPVTGLATDIDRGQRGGHQSHCKRLIRQELQGRSNHDR